MDIYVDGNKIEFVPLFPLTWGTLFQKMLQNESYIPKNHGIVEITVDGVESLHVMTEQSGQMVPETIREIRLATRDSLTITRGGISKVLTLIESIKSETASTADLFREGKIQEASNKVVKIMEAIKPMINFINSVGMGFSLNFDEMMFAPNTPLRVKIESFVTSLNELVKIQEKADYVELADYLEYQLLEDMSDWETVANLLLTEIEALNAPVV